MKRISEAARLHLENVILPFWMGLKDDQHGGYYGYMGQDLILDKQAEKGCILNSRILWFFSESAMALEREDLRDYADHAYRFMTDHCIDRTHGGIFWSMTYDGKPLDTTKHTYNQAFAIYALASYYRLTGKAEALALAKELFRLIEQHCTDEVGYLEAFTADWGPESNEKLSENGILADKTMNTLLHVFEGYSGLYQASPDAELRTALERILDIYADKIYDPELHRQKVFFDADYHSILDLYSYGHDIESSWLMDWGCDLLQDPARSEKIHKINLEIGKAVYEAAYSHRSLANECDRVRSTKCASGGSRRKPSWDWFTCGASCPGKHSTGTRQRIPSASSGNTWWINAPAANGSGPWINSALPGRTSPFWSPGNVPITTDACAWN